MGTLFTILLSTDSMNKIGAGVVASLIFVGISSIIRYFRGDNKNENE